MYKMSNYVGFCLFQLCKLLYIYIKCQLFALGALKILPTAGWSREGEVWMNGKPRCHSVNGCETDRGNVDTVKFLPSQHDLYNPAVDVSQAPVTDKAIKVTFLHLLHYTAQLSHRSILLCACPSVLPKTISCYLNYTGYLDSAIIFSHSLLIFQYDFVGEST